MALPSFALLADPGAFVACADLTGEVWKPCEASTAPAVTAARQSAAVEMASLQGT
jgi:hypothetical protein